MKHAQRTQKVIVASTLAVVVGIGLGGCASSVADTTTARQSAADAAVARAVATYGEALARAERRTSEIVHEVERAQNRSLALNAPAASAPALAAQQERVRAIEKARALERARSKVGSEVGSEVVTCRYEPQPGSYVGTRLVCEQ